MQTLSTDVANLSVLMEFNFLQNLLSFVVVVVSLKITKYTAKKRYSFQVDWFNEYEMGAGYFVAAAIPTHIPIETWTYNRKKKCKQHQQYNRATPAALPVQQLNSENERKLYETKFYFIAASVKRAIKSLA